MTKKKDTITIRDVAKRAGVSVATVSWIINNRTPVSESTANCIQQAVDELNYAPNVTTRKLATAKRR